MHLIFIFILQSVEKKVFSVSCYYHCILVEEAGSPEEDPDTMVERSAGGVGGPEGKGSEFMISTVILPVLWIRFSSRIRIKYETDLIQSCFLNCYTN